jgi:hypothetical protein
MADTWDANAGNQLCTGNAIRNGASTAGLFSITTSIPTELNKEVLTKSQLATYTDIPTGNFPMSELTSLQCPTKDEILGTF